MKKTPVMMPSHILSLLWLQAVAAICTDGTQCLCGCGDQLGCVDVRTVKLPLQQLVGENPLFTVLTNNQGYVNVDNECITSFYLRNSSTCASTIVRFRSTVNSDGSYEVEKYIVSDVPRCTGTYLAVGIADLGCESYIGNDYVIALPCPHYYLSYICSYYGTQDGASGYLRGQSTQTTPNECCAQRIYTAAKAQGFNPSRFMTLPYELNTKCVTRFNGAYCVNAQNVDPKDSIELP